MAIIEKKETSKEVKVKGNLCQWEVFSYTGSVKKKDLVLAGSGKVWCYSEKEVDLNSIRPLITLKDVKDINRQRKTDLGNDLRSVSSGKKLLKAFETIAEFVPSLKPLIDKLKAEIAEGNVKKETITSIENMVKTLK